jgi:two-component system response regulator VicR
MKKILIVEDDDVSARMLCDFLDAHGYTTALARTGPEGVARFEADGPDLMILDVALPLKNGFEVCFDVKRTPRGGRTPVLMMSAVFGNDAKMGRYATDDVRADDWLSKPFGLDTLLARVKTLIGEA